jgi:hypothetical protein
MAFCDFHCLNDHERPQHPSSEVVRFAPHLSGWILEASAVVLIQEIARNHKERASPRKHPIWMVTTISGAGDHYFWGW